MNRTKENEEKLRESACTGDLDQIKHLVEKEHVNINSENSINGWTALHWACKRNHMSVVKYLLTQGADKNVENTNKELPAQLTNTAEIRTMLQYDGSAKKSAPLPIVPSYIQHPIFPYGSDTQNSSSSSNQQPQQQHSQQYTQPPAPVCVQSVNADTDELVLKARVAFSLERDFIEIELPRSSLTFEALLSLLTRELSVERFMVHKIRKLPNTIVRKDKDVKRLQDFQEIELVLTNKAMSSSSRGYGDITDGYKHEQILY